MNKNIRSVSNRQSNTKVSSPYIKSYFTLLKEFEANKEKLLPNKPNEKKPQLIEEIYNNDNEDISNNMLIENKVTE